jgi:hypothetical protein
MFSMSVSTGQRACLSVICNERGSNSDCCKPVTLRGFVHSLNDAGP